MAGGVERLGVADGSAQAFDEFGNVRIRERKDSEFLVESPRGISPRGAHRTVREPLDSHGSYHPAARGVTPAAHWENKFGSRLATLTNHRDALRLRL